MPGNLTIILSHLLSQVIELMKKCFAQVKKRFIINMPNFQLQIVDKDGIHDAGIWPPPTEQDVVAPMME